MWTQQTWPLPSFSLQASKGNSQPWKQTLRCELIKKKLHDHLLRITKRLILNYTWELDNLNYFLVPPNLEIPGIPGLSLYSLLLGTPWWHLGIILFTFILLTFTSSHHLVSTILILVPTPISQGHLYGHWCLLIGSTSLVQQGTNDRV